MCRVIHFANHKKLYFHLWQLLSESEGDTFWFVHVFQSIQSLLVPLVVPWRAQFHRKQQNRYWVQFCLPVCTLIPSMLVVFVWGKMECLLESKSLLHFIWAGSEFMEKVYLEVFSYPPTMHPHHPILGSHLCASARPLPFHIYCLPFVHLWTEICHLSLIRSSACPFFFLSLSLSSLYLPYPEQKR